MYMANANQILAYQMQTILHLLALGLALSLEGLLLGLQWLALGLQGLALGLRGFLDTNMLVSATQITHVGGRTQSEPPT